MEVAEAREVLEAGRTSTGARLWQQVVDLLEPVHQTQLLSGHEQGEAALLVGQAHAWLGDWDKAGPFLDEAVQLGSSQVQQQASALRDQALHQGVAVLAEEGGVEANEAMLVLAAADEALAREDWAAASGHYEKVYNGSASGDRVRPLARHRPLPCQHGPARRSCAVRRVRRPEWLGRYRRAGEQAPGMDQRPARCRR